LQPDITRPENHEMLWNDTQLECFYMSQGLRFSQSGRFINDSSATCTDQYLISLEKTRLAAIGRDFYQLRTDHAPDSEDELSSCQSEQIRITFDLTIYHSAFPFADFGHVDPKARCLYSEFLEPPCIGKYLRGVNHILRRQAGNVVA